MSLSVERRGKSLLLDYSWNSSASLRPLSWFYDGLGQKHAAQAAHILAEVEHGVHSRVGSCIWRNSGHGGPRDKWLLGTFSVQTPFILQETGVKDTRHFKNGHSSDIYFLLKAFYCVQACSSDQRAKHTLQSNKIRRHLHPCILLEKHCDDSYCHAFFFFISHL